MESGGDVGIGQTNPYTDVVIGSGTPTSNWLYDGSAEQAIVYAPPSGTAGLLLSSYSQNRIGFDLRGALANKRLFALDHQGFGTSSYLKFESLLDNTGLTATANILVLTHEGNVGVGEGTPDAKLHVKGYGAQTAEYTANLIENTATTNAFFQTKKGVSIINSGVWSSASGSVKGLDISTTAGSSNTQNIGLNIAATGLSSITTGLAVDVSGGTTNYSGTFIGGNVGIGTTAPSNNLDIEDNTAKGGGIDINATGIGDPALVFQLGGAPKYKFYVDNSEPDDPFKLNVSPTGNTFMATSDGRFSFGAGTPDPGSAKILISSFGNTLNNYNLFCTGATNNLFGIRSDAVVEIYNWNGITQTPITNGIVLYAEDIIGSSELKVMDEAGNATTLSPHNFSGIPNGKSEDMAWAMYSENKILGKSINVDMLKTIRLVEKMSGEKLVYINSFEEDQIKQIAKDKEENELGIEPSLLERMNALSEQLEALQNENQELMNELMEVKQKIED